MASCSVIRAGIAYPANIESSFVANGTTRESAARTGIPRGVAEVEDLLVMPLLHFAEKVARKRPFRLTGCPESEKLSATSRHRTFLGGQ